MGERWILNRAGITNVYQYADEMLHFGGRAAPAAGCQRVGQVDGDEHAAAVPARRRHVAASTPPASSPACCGRGCCPGVTSSAPVGYLWIEFERGGEHPACAGAASGPTGTPSASRRGGSSRPPRPDSTSPRRRAGPAQHRRAAGRAGRPCRVHLTSATPYRPRSRPVCSAAPIRPAHPAAATSCATRRVGDRIDVDLPKIPRGRAPAAVRGGHRRCRRSRSKTSRSTAATSRTWAAPRRPSKRSRRVYQSYAQAELRRRATDLLERPGPSVNGGATKPRSATTPTPRPPP